MERRSSAVTRRETPPDKWAAILLNVKRMNENVCARICVCVFIGLALKNRFSDLASKVSFEGMAIETSEVCEVLRARNFVESFVPMKMEKIWTGFQKIFTESILSLSSVKLWIFFNYFIHWFINILYRHLLKWIIIHKFIKIILMWKPEKIN